VRIVCLDVGSKRIGIAATDELGIAVHGISVLTRRGGRRDFETVARLCTELQAEKLVIGIPLDENGRKGPAARKIKQFADRLAEFLEGIGKPIPIEMWDESFSTAEAESMLIDFNVSRAGRRKVLDKMAAVVILNDYLDFHRG